MKNVFYLIREARQVARNDANPDGTYAIPDDEVLRYLNDAQDRMQALLCSLMSYNKIFIAQKTITVVADQEAYSIPDRLYMNKEFVQVDYSYSGLATDFRLLDKLNFINRNTTPSDYPYGYFRAGGQIYLVPIPASGTSALIRALYERTVDDLDIRRASVSVVTGLTATTFTSMTLAFPVEEYETTTPGFETIDYVCVCDPDGVVKAYNIPRGTYNSGTNVFTPSAGFTFYREGDTIEVGDFVTFAKFTTTNSQLPDECETYLVHSAALAMLAKDSSRDANEQQNKVTMLEQQLMNAYSSQTSEVQYIPQLDYYEWY